MACPYGDSFTRSAAVGHNLSALTGLGERGVAHTFTCMYAPGLRRQASLPITSGQLKKRWQ